MAVLINFKVCDNAKECGGVEVCPTGAISWNEDKNSIVLDNSKCISCGKCVNWCPVNAIHVAKTNSEYKKLEKEIENDSRKASDLFVDRYGAQPIDPDCLLEEESLENFLLHSKKKVLIELFNKDSIKCLLRSNTISKLIPGEDIFFKKLEVKNKNFLKEYTISKIPSLLAFSKREFLGKIEGFYSVDESEKLRKKIINLFKN